MNITLNYDGPTFCDGCAFCDLENVGEVIFRNLDAPDFVENRPYRCRNRRICENAVKLHDDTITNRKVGHWEVINDGFDLRCSECGFIRWARPHYPTRIKPHFCESCGAVMDVEVIK